MPSDLVVCLVMVVTEVVVAVVDVFEARAASLAGRNVGFEMVVKRVSTVVCSPMAVMK